MISEVRAPRSTTDDERLHQGALRFNSMHEIVRGPLVHQLAERHDPQLAMPGGSWQVLWRQAGKLVQARRSQPREFGRKLMRRVLCVRAALGVRIEGCEV